MDKVKQAQYAVKELKDELQKGVKNLFDNQENLNCLNEKTVLMKGTTKITQDTPNNLKKHQNKLKEWPAATNGKPS